MYELVCFNKMKKSVCFIVLLVLFISACQPSIPSKGPSDVRQVSGSEGLRISFLDNLPPPKLFDNEEFNAVIQIENKGSADVGGSGDKIFLSGFDPSFLSGISNFGMQIPSLKGVNLITLQGDLETVSFNGKFALLKGLGAMNVPLKLLLTACYDYETMANPSVCIDPTPFSPVLRQKVCSAQSVSTGTQGAPIAVSSVDVLPSTSGTKFKIYVNNVGGGRVFRSGLSGLSKCNPSVAWTDFFKDSDYVEVQDILISGVSIKNSCKGLDQNHVRLQNGKGMFFCDFDRIKGTSAYTTQLIIKLKYGYETTQLKNIDLYSSS